MANPIESQNKRAKLAPRHSPYWHRLRGGIHIGFRKAEDGHGSLMAKIERGSSRVQKSFGSLVDGEHTAYEQARRMAERWAAEIDRGVTPHGLKVRDACLRYIKRVRAERGDTRADDEEGKLKRLVLADPLADVLLSQLRKKHLDDWRARVRALPARVTRGKNKDQAGQETKPRSDATLNRDMSPLRAALNQAVDDELISGDMAWRVALRAVKGAGTRRTLYLTNAQRGQLVEKASDEIRPLLTVLASLPTRPGAIAALTVADFNGRHGTLRIGKDKVSGEQWVRVSKLVSDLLKKHSTKRKPSDVLLPRLHGVAWDKDSWYEPIKEAAESAGLPASTTAYTLRHSVITDLVVDGLDLLTVAKISGTSVAMIEKHYGHLRQDRAVSALERIAISVQERP